MPSSTRPGPTCQPASFGIVTTASSGRAPNSRHGRRRPPSISATPSGSAELARRTRRLVHPRNWRYSGVTELKIPNMSLVVLIGASGSGKSTFARTHFRPTEVLSSDACRGMVADDENDQSATTEAFDILHYIAAKRLAAGRLTVVDATNVQSAARKPLVE